MRLMYISASDFGYRCLEHIIKIKGITIVGIVTLEESTLQIKKNKMPNVHYVSYEEIAYKYKIPIFYLGNNQKMDVILDWIIEREPDVGMAIGWYKKIPQSVLNIPKYGILGIHASLLPKYRGGAPLVWAIINGEREVGVSMFYFTEKMDEGDLIAQYPFEITFNDYICDVYLRMEEYSIEMLKNILPQFIKGEIKSWNQEELQENTRDIWPMRIPADGRIDWSKPAVEIYNFIRAQSKPYPGAFTFYAGEKVHIWRSKVLESNFKLEANAGTIVEIVDINRLIVAVNEKSLLLIEELSYERDQSGKKVLNIIPFKVGTVFEN